MLGDHPIDDIPINLLISMHRRISEAHRFDHALSRCRIQAPGFPQSFEGLRHRFGNRDFQIADNMKSDINTGLYGAFQIQSDYALQILPDLFMKMGGIGSFF